MSDPGFPTGNPAGDFQKKRELFRGENRAQAVSQGALPLPNQVRKSAPEGTAYLLSLICGLALLFTGTSPGNHRAVRPVGVRSTVGPEPGRDVGNVLVLEAQGHGVIHQGALEVLPVLDAIFRDELG